MSKKERNVTIAELFVGIAIVAVYIFSGIRDTLCIVFLSAYIAVFALRLILVLIQNRKS